MKRELLTMRRHVSGCCPGHDTWPNDTYANRRSERARSRDKAREHRLTRRINRQTTEQERRDYANPVAIVLRVLVNEERSR